MRRLFGEIRASLDTNPDLQILLGHGSGSFGHVPASKYNTIQGVHTPEEWQGFSEVWQAAHALESHRDGGTGLRRVARICGIPFLGDRFHATARFWPGISPPSRLPWQRASFRLSSVTRASTKPWAGRSFPRRTSSSISPPACAPGGSFSPGRKRGSGRIFRSRSTWFQSSPCLP